MSTTTFQPLSSLLGSRRIKRIITRVSGSSTNRVVKSGKSFETLVKKLSPLQGELCYGTWAASFDSCKSLGYGTVLVVFEEAE